MRRRGWGGGAASRGSAAAARTDSTVAAFALDIFVRSALVLPFALGSPATNASEGGVRVGALVLDLGALVERNADAVGVLAPIVKLEPPRARVAAAAAASRSGSEQSRSFTTSVSAAEYVRPPSWRAITSALKPRAYAETPRTFHAKCPPGKLVTGAGEACFKSQHTTTRL